MSFQQWASSILLAPLPYFLRPQELDRPWDLVMDIFDGPMNNLHVNNGSPVSAVRQFQIDYLSKFWELDIIKDD